MATHSTQTTQKTSTQPETVKTDGDVVWM